MYHSNPFLTLLSLFQPCIVIASTCPLLLNPYLKIRTPDFLPLPTWLMWLARHAPGHVQAKIKSPFQWRRNAVSCCNHSHAPSSRIPVSASQEGGSRKDRRIETEIG